MQHDKYAKTQKVVTFNTTNNPSNIATMMFEGTLKQHSTVIRINGNFFASNMQRFCHIGTLKGFKSSVFSTVLFQVSLVECTVFTVWAFPKYLIMYFHMLHEFTRTFKPLFADATIW